MAKEKLPVYEPKQIEEKLNAQLPQWEYRDGWIRRTYKTGGWPFTLMVVNAIGYLAEAGFHHPDLSVSWAQVQVKLMTHSEKGVTDNDFELAKLIEQHVTWRPTEAQALTGFEKGFGKKWTR